VSAEQSRKSYVMYGNHLLICWHVVVRDWCCYVGVLRWWMSQLFHNDNKPPSQPRK
jgi:hypothetical protein